MDRKPFEPIDWTLDYTLDDVGTEANEAIAQDREEYQRAIKAKGCACLKHDLTYIGCGRCADALPELIAENERFRHALERIASCYDEHPENSEYKQGLRAAQNTLSGIARAALAGKGEG